MGLFARSTTETQPWLVDCEGEMIRDALGLYGFGVDQFRSFSSGDYALVGPCEKVHVITGQNNTGKSALIDAFSRAMPVLASRTRNAPHSEYSFNSADMPASAKYATEPRFALCLRRSEVVDAVEGALPPNYRNELRLQVLMTVLDALSVPNKAGEYFWLQLDVPSSEYSQQLSIDAEQLKLACESISFSGDRLELLRELAEALGVQSGSVEVCTKAILERIVLWVRYPHVVKIPAIRNVKSNDKSDKDNGAQGPQAGVGLPERLLAILNPKALQSLTAKATQDRMERFVRDVLNDQTARIQVSYETHEVLVKTEDSPLLPLSSLGTGIEELVILGLTIALTDSSTICIEEPEIHLHPTLLRRFVAFLQDDPTNRFIIATHSPALINANGVSATHVTKRGGVSYAETVADLVSARRMLDDIGAHASDVLQSNYVVWVEGPSDRVYVNGWVHSVDPNLVEGVHYSVMFYGGRLLNSLAVDWEGGDGGLIPLLRINTHCCVLIDSDITAKTPDVNETKKRVIKGCEQQGSFAWVTWGATIENYYPGDDLETALRDLYPNEKYSHTLGRRNVHPLGKTFDGRKGKQPDKIKVAKWLVESRGIPEDSRKTGLRESVLRLVDEIRRASGEG